MKGKKKCKTCPTKHITRASRTQLHHPSVGLKAAMFTYRDPPPPEVPPTPFVVNLGRHPGFDNYWHPGESFMGLARATGGRYETTLLGGRGAAAA